MPKVLCLISLVASILVVVLFMADAVFGMAGMESLAPLGNASLIMDIAFAVFGLILVFLSLSTYRQLRN